MAHNGFSLYCARLKSTILSPSTKVSKKQKTSKTTSAGHNLNLVLYGVVPSDQIPPGFSDNSPMKTKQIFSTYRTLRLEVEGKKNERTLTEAEDLCKHRPWAL